MPCETIPSLFEAQSQRIPDSVAVVDDARAITYGTLNARANRLARALVDEGAGPETRVAVAGERSIDMVTMLLAILKAGAAYLPLDPSYPESRLVYALREASPLGIVTTASEARRWHPHGRVLLIDELDQRAWRYPADDLVDAERACPLGPDNAAYVIFTSGSSGMPKGVVGLHQGIVNRAQWYQSVFSAGSDGSVLAKTAIGFIDGLTELLTPLLSGGRIVLASTEAATSLRQLATLIRRHAVRYVTVVPVLLQAIADECHDQDLSGCVWISSGEQLSVFLARRILGAWSDTTLMNLYGVSEASGDSLWSVCQPSDTAFDDTLLNTQVFLLDESLEVVPTGVCGELFIGGPSLARGYLNRPGLTAERFIANPFGEPGSRLYRTGDLGRRQPDGRIEIVGRADRQVKIAGVRTELGEIESALQQDEGVRDAVVVSAEVDSGTQLTAYVVLRHGAVVDGDALRNRLRRVLPSQMVPAAIVILAAMPRLPNGKLDRAALPAPVPLAGPSDEASAADVRAIREIFVELFGDVELGSAGDFFEAGGHSLKAMRLVSRVAKRLGVELPLSAVFDTPRIADLAHHVARLRAMAHASELRGA